MTSDVLEGNTSPTLHPSDSSVQAGPEGSSPAGRTPAQRPVSRPPVATFGPGQRLFGLVLAVPTIMLGIALGISDVAATSTPMGLRTPAMLAALLMVGQGGLDVIRFVAGKASRPILSPLVPVVLLVLAVWLGLGLLRASAPADLVTLCLISAFVLFTLGWSLLRERT